ncbi:glycosyltransferase [Paenibacillus chitinolyticus]|uniref:glycosyltransferase n=1 Tax=Paenibacillus chitinolyticus TaxID=79263 RepID=UPI0035DA2B9F
MAHLFIAVQRVLGHVVPALAIGQQLKKKGHEVTLVTHPANKELTVRAGLDFLPAEWGKFPEKFIYEQALEMDALLAGREVDWMICDSSQAAPAYAAERRGIPWISLQTTVPYPEEALPGSRTVFNRLRQSYARELNGVRMRLGLPPLTDDRRTRGDLAGLSPRLHLVNVHAALYPEEGGIPEQSVFTGSCTLQSGDRDRVNEASRLEPEAYPGRPVVLVCASSTERHDSREVMNRYIGAAVSLSEENSFNLIVAEHKPYEGKRPLPPHVRWITAYPNHDLLLPRADAVITHGGCGTVQSIMRYGVPMVVIPLASDQHLLARTCERLGIALTVGPEEAGHGRIGQALHSLLAEGNPYTPRAKELAAIVGRDNPNEAAVRAIEQVLQNNS